MVIKESKKVEREEEDCGDCGSGMSLWTDIGWIAAIFFIVIFEIKNVWLGVFLIILFGFLLNLFYQTLKNRK